MKAIPQVQWAAGGLVRRQAGGSSLLAVIHRPRYDDWTLPKGKPEEDETPGQTAQREVREELGCEVQFGKFAGVTHYELPDGRIKLVPYWHMVSLGEFTFRPNDEVDEVLWLPAHKAAERLTYPRERELVAMDMNPN